MTMVATTVVKETEEEGVSAQRDSNMCFTRPTLGDMSTNESVRNENEVYDVEYDRTIDMRPGFDSRWWWMKPIRSILSAGYLVVSWLQPFIKVQAVFVIAWMIVWLANSLTRWSYGQMCVTLFDPKYPNLMCSSLQQIIGTTEGLLTDGLKRGLTATLDVTIGVLDRMVKK